MGVKTGKVNSIIVRIDDVCQTIEKEKFLDIYFEHMLYYRKILVGMGDIR